LPPGFYWNGWCRYTTKITERGLDNLKLTAAKQTQTKITRKRKKGLPNISGSPFYYYFTAFYAFYISKPPQVLITWPVI